MRVSVYHNVAADGDGQMINFAGYRPGQPVVHVLDAELDSAAVACADLDQLGSQVFTACNLQPDEVTGWMRTVATAYRHRGLRSQSVGDLTAIGSGAARTVLSVDRFGFSTLAGPLNIVTACQHGTLPWISGHGPALVWMLRRWDHIGDRATPHPTAEHALSHLAIHVRAHWAVIAGQPGVPATPPLSDQAAVDLYYGPARPLDRIETAGWEAGPGTVNETYSLYRVELPTPPPTPRPAITAAHPHLAIDLGSADGRAIYRLFCRLKSLEQRDGNWPGADVIPVLTDWLTRCGFDIAAAAPGLADATSDDAASAWTRVDEGGEHPRWRHVAGDGRAYSVTDYAITTYGRRHIEGLLARLPQLPDRAWDADHAGGTR